ncbi:DMT family transporter [Streptomyces sp. MUM 178J]|uniref:DMT family transporter n=1 Tax=Streptomyces sp. MUM 178J TaxID=2791991 RepID=UPI001F03A71D|nr:DMT family transporter [Streptomyces sp. MUM 178J]WRQ78065.1 DMT family transporter [Streptomyces sp. MUM 178J]
MWGAVVASLAAAACFALAGVLQQRAAARRPDEESLSPALVRHLVRQPMWLGGIGLAVLAYGFQALALAHAPLSLVQPLIVCELVFAIPLAARLARTRLGPREWAGTAAVTCGLAVALLAARPQGGSTEASPGGWLLTLGALGGLAAAALAAGRAVAGPPKASLIALAAGVVMGGQSVLLDATVDRFDEGAAAVFASWQTYLLVAASLGGLLLIQSAFQAGPLAAGMPVIDAAEPAVAIAVGIGLFGESLRGGWAAGVAAGCGAVVTLAGIVALDTSPVLRALYGRQTAGRRKGVPSGAG